MGDDLERTHAAFTTTHWTLIEGLRSGDESSRSAAAAEAAERYWPPVYACARRLTRSRDEASELTQAFFAEVIVRRGLLEQAKRERGRVRSLLRSSLKRFATDQWRREAARGGGRSVVLGELDREDALLGVNGSAGGNGSVDIAFDRRWALGVLQEALRRCEAHYERAGKRDHWRLFEARVLTPAIHGNAAPSLGTVAALHGFGSSAAAAAGVQTVKRRLDVILREVVAETVEDPADAEDEFGAVLGLLGDAAPPA